MRIDLAGFAREGELGDHRALMRLVERADRLGYDGIWFNEFHFRGDTNPYPSTLMLGAEILGRTERLRFGTSILVLALQHPLLLAELVAQLDFQSGGRLDIGIGRGTDASTFETLGIPAEEIRSRFERGLDIMIAAWTHGRVSSASGPWRFEDIAVGPPVSQRPHPPIYVAGVSEETIGFAAARDFPLLLTLEPCETRQLRNIEAVVADGEQRARMLERSSLSRYIVVAATAAAAKAKLEDLVEKLNTRRAALAAAKGQAAPEPRDMDTMLAEHAVAGTPEACADQIRALSARTGSKSLRLFFSANGAISNFEALAGMELFAREALPSLRPLADEPAISLTSRLLEETE